MKCGLSSSLSKHVAGMRENDASIACMQSSEHVPTPTVPFDVLTRPWHYRVKADADLYNMIPEITQILRITGVCLWNAARLAVYPRSRVAIDLLRDLAQVNIIFLKIFQVMTPSIDGASELQQPNYTTQVPFHARDVPHACIRKLQAAFPIVIESHPIYSGSSCLIYHATYNERPVIVKIKRLGLQEYIGTSVFIARMLCRLIDALALLPFLSMADICAEVVPNIVDQTEFTNELYNMHLFQRRFNTADSHIRIPETYDEFTSFDESVIVMEHVRGEHVQTLESEHRRRMCALISHFNMRCIVEHAMFHGDLHCGNVLYHAESDVLYVLDFGITGYLDRKEVGTLLAIMKAYAWKNFHRMAYLVVTEMSELPKDIPAETLVAFCDCVKDFLSEIYQTRTVVQYDDITQLYALVKAKHIRIGRTFHRLQMALGITNAMCTSYITPDENNVNMHESFRLVLGYVLSYKGSA